MKSKKEIFKLLIKEFHEFDFPRVIERDLSLPRKTNKIITITGARRVGKTFYFYQLMNKLKKRILFNRILYVNFEDDRILPLSYKNLNDLLEAYFELYPENKNREVYIFFDEIQNIKNWELFIRRIYDKEKMKIFLTGSSSKLLSREISTSLRGRTLTYGLYPLSFREFLRFKGVNLKSGFEYSQLRFKIKNLMEEFIFFGGFPEVVLEEKNLKFQILKNYYDLVVYKDLSERFSIRNVQLLKNLIKFLITNVSTSFSANSYYRSVKGQLHSSRETIMEYLSYIEEIELISFLPIFSYSVKVQQVNPKKIYSVDNGLRNAVSFRFSEDYGRLVENLVFQELRRQDIEIYYWKNKSEVDFVIKKGFKMTRVIQVTTDINDFGVRDREIKGLIKAMEEFGLKKGLLITDDYESQENIKDKTIDYMPLWKWLLKGFG